MSTPDTQHPQYDDDTIQAAIDAAFEACTDGGLSAIPMPSPESVWQRQAPARLALARGLLARLPEPPPPWQPAVGEPVRLVSGGPAMTVIKWCEEFQVLDCGWFVRGEYCTDSWAAACLVSAKEAQP